MATYLQLVNYALRRVNEVELTADTFSTAREFQAFVKDAVNDSIRDIYEEEHFWPFLLQSATPVSTVAGTQFYDLETAAATIDWDSFYIAHGTDITARKLSPIDLQVWRDYYQSNDLEKIANGSTSWGTPDYVFRDPTATKFGVTTIPDKVYSINYNFWKVTSDMSNATDTPDVPERFHHVITDRLMFYCYMFREDFQSAKIYDNKYSKGLSRMRSELINVQKEMRG